ncbi:hypothetical protein LJC58_07645 [Lachnospiraceae bacterium OttesenSCG-928-D06]|nr:hypothetical protein [Lachnospiraceae bacterium OttesenSCG-928-D06]
MNGRIIELTGIVLVICLVGCSNSLLENDLETKYLLQESVVETASLEHPERAINTEGNVNGRTPVKCQWIQGDISYDITDTIYYKTFYDDFVRGYQMNFVYPDVNIQDNIEDYFAQTEYDFEKMSRISQMFYDNRTIDMDEETLKDLFYKYGYEVCFHSASIDDLQVRFIEIRELNGLSLYLSHILLQTWDDEHIYLQDVTSPISRTIRSFITIEGKEELKLIVHSSGFSKDLVAEEELSFWLFRGTYWILAPIDLTIDSSHAHSAGDMYADVDRDSLFSPIYYKDGIVYRTSMQGDGLHTYAHRLEKLEEVEENVSFRLVSISEVQGQAFEDIDCYLHFKIN